MSRKLTLLFSLAIYCHLLCTHLLLLLSMVICFNFLPFSLICSTNMLLFVPSLAVPVQAKPFITADILTAKTERSKLESIYRKCKSPTNLENFKKQETFVAKLITASRRSFYRNLISQCSSQPKKLWSALDSLLSRKIPPCLPTCSSPSQLASTFLNFFNDKIVKLCSSLIVTGNPIISPHSPPQFPPLSLSFFSPTTEAKVRNAIMFSSNATCTLDSIPTQLLKSCLDALIQPITTIINLSLTEGPLPDCFKSVIVTPLHKKHKKHSAHNEEKRIQYRA